MTTNVKTRVKQFLQHASKKLKELNSEEAKLRRMSREATKEENRLEREERLAYIKAERYRLKRQVEQAKLAYLKTKHKRQTIEKSTGGDNLITKADKVLSSIFGTSSSNKKSAKRKPAKKKDDWNFWD